MEATSDTTKILEKGPKYLRKQMELESETKGRMSAVERLAASKPKYVKSQHVVNSTQEPVISLGSASATDKECAAECNKEKITTPEGTAKECSSQSERRRNGVAGQHSTEYSDPGSKVTAGVVKKSAGLLTVPEFESRSGKGVSRSHSDISSRYSKNFADFDAFFKYCGLGGEVIESFGKDNFSAHSDEIAINIRSVSISTSDDGFSRNSGDSDGLMEDKLHEKIRQETSVIERNARIIKWLYSCRNAIETGKKLRDLD
ncbi:protein FAM110C [Perca flavescens]|uniref:protein FAM110C n=1 Tax=Perca flavescens TaxID=8167 RepID=UPI00106E2F4D|nr:protein FAM110C [Perca flavescens]